MFGTLTALAMAGQAAASGTPAPASVTMQQRFDAASQAAGAGRCQEAIAGFEAIEAAGATRRNAMLGAAVDVRKGGCLIRIGRAAEGVAAIRRGLPTLSAKGADFAMDVQEAHMLLGNAAQRMFDYDEAARQYRTVADGLQGQARIVPLLRLSQVTMFDRDGRALAAAGEARTLAFAAPNYPKKDLAAVQTQYARVLLNEGRTAEAYRELKAGLMRQGGLDNRVGASDIATRSDLAIAALLNKDMENARLYLAYTGAGRMKSTPFTRAASMSPPACGEGGITPEDQAVVEFTLEEDGHVSGVVPIYTTGRRSAAIAFAQAVKDWSWRAEDAAKVPLLFRYTTRVELRCSKAVEGPGILGPLREAAATWLDEQAGPAPWADLSDAAALPLQRAALERARAAGDRAAIARAAMALADNSVTTPEETRILLQGALAAASAARATPPVLNRMTFRLMMLNDQAGAEDYRRNLRTLLARSDFAGDPLSAATLRLLIARPYGKAPPPPDVDGLLHAVATDTALPANHPLKVAARLG